MSDQFGPPVAGPSTLHPIAEGVEEVVEDDRTGPVTRSKGKARATS